MFEQLTTLVKQFAGDAVVNNPAVPNEQNTAVTEEAGNSIFSNLKNMATENAGGLAEIITGKSPIDLNNPAIKELTEKVTGNLGEKFGMSPEAANSVAGGLIPQVLSGLVNKAKDPNQPEFNVTDLVGALSGGNSGGLMDAVSKYGGMLGLDQDGDGQVGMNDAVSAITKKSGGLGSLFGKLFGSK